MYHACPQINLLKTLPKDIFKRKLDFTIADVTTYLSQLKSDCKHKDNEIDVTELQLLALSLKSALDYLKREISK